MIIFVLITCIFFAPTTLHATGSTSPDSSYEQLDPNRLTFIRNSFYASVESHSNTNRLIQYIESTFSDEYIYDEPVLLAYYGALSALKAKHVFNPFSKISYLRSALRKLEEATYEGACNLEVRFLRFSVLHNIPSFIRNNDELKKETDAVYELLVVDELYNELDRELAYNVIEFVLQSKRLNSNQQEQLEVLAEYLKDNEHLSTN